MSKPVRSGKDMAVSIDTIKYFLGKMEKRYSFKEKSDSQQENPISTKPSVNKVMEIIIKGENDLSTHDPIGNATDKGGLMELFDQFSSLKPSMSD